MTHCRTPYSNASIFQSKFLLTLWLFLMLQVQENCIDLVGRIADRGAEYVPAREWMRICFELLEMLKAHKKGIRCVHALIACACTCLWLWGGDDSPTFHLWLH